MLCEMMVRVDRQNRCPICGKPDWCLVAGDRSAAICARIEEGSVKRCGDAGWLHVLQDKRYNGHRRRGGPKPKTQTVPLGSVETKDFGQLAERYRQQLTQGQLDGLAGSLGVSPQSLKRLRTGWDGSAFTFPMSNDFGKIVGVRRRFPNGRKVSATGSKTGLFVPDELPVSGPLLICEGATDTAAALDLGFKAIGRPSCNSKVEMTAKAARGRTEIVVISDGDEVGRAGAERLAHALVLHCPSVKVVFPPDGTKDVREWLQAGLNSATLLHKIKQLRPIKVGITFRD